MRIAAFLVLAVRPASAHPDSTVTAGPWWTAWDLDPVLMFGLAAAWWLYSRGLVAAWEGCGTGRGVTRVQAAAFGGGLLTLFLALASPLDSLSGQLSSAHMIQHELLMLLAAPLLALGSPVAVVLWALPSGWRKRPAAWLRRAEGWYTPSKTLWQPVIAWALYAAALWVWHAPVLYMAALRSRSIHDLQHLSFLLTACIFWRVVLDPIRRMRLSRGSGVLYLFTTCLHASALGIFMTLSPQVWYLDYRASAPAWHLTGLEDQQLAGAIMWMPACLVYACAAAALFNLWLREPKERPAVVEPAVP